MQQAIQKIQELHCVAARTARLYEEIDASLERKSVMIAALSGHIDPIEPSDDDLRNVLEWARNTVAQAGPSGLKRYSTHSEAGNQRGGSGKRPRQDADDA